MKDITDRQDIELFIDNFYQKVRKNEIIGFIFNDIANVDWDKHLPLIYEFWSSILLGSSQYQGNPMQVHIALSEKVHMGKKEFDTWLSLFNSTIDQLFCGEKAEEAKLRAKNIAALMQYKIAHK